jgi:UPF0755 protein
MTKTRRGALLAALAALALVIAGWFVFGAWFSSGPLEKDRTFIVSNGDSLTAVAERLEKEGIVSSARPDLRGRLADQGRRVPDPGGSQPIARALDHPERRGDSPPGDDP